MATVRVSQRSGLWEVKVKIRQCWSLRSRCSVPDTSRDVAKKTDTVASRAAIVEVKTVTTKAKPYSENTADLWIIPTPAGTKRSDMFCNKSSAGLVRLATASTVPIFSQNARSAIKNTIPNTGPGIGTPMR